MSELDLERSLSHLSSWNLCPNSHQEPPRNDSCNVVAIPHHIFGQGDLVEEINHSESSSWEVSVDLANFFNKCPISHTRLVLAPLGDANQVLNFSTLPSQLFEPSFMGLCSNQATTFEIFSQEFKHGHIIGESTLHFPSWSSVMSNKSFLWVVGEGV